MRPHASYFDFKGHREGTAIGVVRDWLPARYPCPKDVFARIEHCTPPHDPPDVILTAKDGSLNGIEVTKFVDAESIRRAVKGKGSDFKEYSEAELADLIQQRVREKSEKPFKTPCDQSVLLIYSDELELSAGAGSVLLANLAAPRNEVFTEIWFMIPQCKSSDRPFSQSNGRRVGPR